MARIVLFDIDMTLIRTQKAGRASVEAAFAEAFGLESPTEGVSFDGRTDHAIFMEIVARHGLGPDAESAYRKASDAYLAVLGPTIATREGEVLPGIHELLPALKASHGAIGLATGNMERGAQIKLGHFGLWDWFAGGGFGDSTPVRAEVVRSGIDSLAAVLGVAASPLDTIIIGDTPLDVDAAHKAGARALAVATGSYDIDTLRQNGAEWVLPDLSDIERVMALLGS